MLHMSHLFQKIIYFILVTNIENHQTKWKAMLTKNSIIDNTVLKKKASRTRQKNRIKLEREPQDLI